MVSLIPPTPEQQRERQRIEKLIRDRMQNTLGNEYKKSTQRIAKLNKLRDTFLDKSLKSGKYRAAAEYMTNIKRFNAMPDSIKQRATPPRPSREVSQQMATINRRYNTLVRRDYKTDLAAIDKFEKRSRQFEHDLRLKHDKGYRPNRGGGGFFGLFGSRPEDREGFRTWAAQNDPEFYKRQQRFIKKYGEDPQKYTSFIPGLPRQRDIREEAAYSRRFINREEYDKARADAFKRYNEYKRKQPRKPYKPLFKVNPILPNSAFTPATPNRSQQQTQALFDAQRAQFLRQQEAANKLKPIKTTTTTTSKPAKPVQPVMSSAPKQQPIKKIKSGGKVTKKYANGGSVRKPKYKG